jgi:predicted dithiol-disulfide oxidoreductase (DUF899 family)
MKSVAVVSWEIWCDGCSLQADRLGLHTVELAHADAKLVAMHLPVVLMVHDMNVQMENEVHAACRSRKYLARAAMALRTGRSGTRTASCTPSRCASSL